MLKDLNNEFTINQSALLRGQLITSTAAEAGNTKVLDAGAAIDWGSGELVVPFVELVAGAALDVGTSIKIDIVASSTVALTGTAQILSTITILTAALVSTTGAIFAMPPLLPGYPRRYLGVIFTITGDASTGALVVGLVPKDARLQSYGGSGPV